MWKVNENRWAFNPGDFQWLIPRWGGGGKAEDIYINDGADVNTIF